MNRQQKLNLFNWILLGSTWVSLSDSSLTISLLFSQYRKKKRYKQGRCVYAQVNQMVHVILVRMSAFTESVNMCTHVRHTVSLNTWLILDK